MVEYGCRIEGDVLRLAHEQIAEERATVPKGVKIRSIATKIGFRDDGRAGPQEIAAYR
jgi:hypothetical protein